MGATYTSFYFLCFFAVVLLFYYLIPKKMQWVMLLISSIAYYLLAGNGILILYPISTCLIAWIGIWILERTKESRKRKAVLLAVVFSQIMVLSVLKYINFGIGFLIPLGISFYTVTVLGYVIDVYNGIAKGQKNPGKLLLYGMFFPTVLSGPILRYREDGDQFFEPHVFDYKQVTFGIQRMVWGFFKTLVISERMSVIVNTVYGDYTTYKGTYIWIAAVCYAFQLYTNFSGCMDIALGMAQTFGIKLPENFTTPYLAKSISEYWRRWHITLGVWMKEYVFYPLLRTSAFNKLGKWMKQKYGKKRGKQFVTFIALFILWFTVGLWHGGDWKYIIGSGLLHWVYIVLEELWAPGFGKVLEKCHIDFNGRGVNIFRIVRTFFLVCIGQVFFRADSVGHAWQLLKGAVTEWNPQVLWNGGIFTLGLDWVEFVIALVSLGILAVVSILQNKGINIRESISKKKLPIRWLIWYMLLFYVILLGYYGPGYSAAEFIYQGF